jgi:hypothetical protein
VGGSKIMRIGKEKLKGKAKNFEKNFPLKHIRDAGGLGRGIPFLSDSFFSHRILKAWFI